MERWRVQLRDGAGALVALIDEFDSFSYTQYVNGVGGWALRFAKRADETEAAFEARCAPWTLDAQVEFWQSNDDPAINWRKDFEGFVRWQHFYVRVDGSLVYEIGGRGLNDLLGRRIILAPAGSAHAQWDAQPAETIMKDIVSYQCGPNAAAERRITGLTVQADTGAGNVLTMGRPYRNVLEILQEIAKLGGGDFAVVQTAPATWQFRWYTGQLGTDRTATVVFALERGNMAEPSLRIARQDEVNVVYVGGQGEGAARAIVSRTNPSLIDDSTWNRCEAFTSAANEPNTSGLEAAGDALLEEKRPRQTLAFKTVQTPGCWYGYHYFLGDLVTTKFMAFSGVKKITSVTITCNESGAAETTKTLETEDVQ
jgi:hypothetical protein